MEKKAACRNVTSLNDWVKEGIKKYGYDREKWQYKCPKCGNVQEGNYKKCSWCGYDTNGLFARKGRIVVLPVFKKIRVFDYA